jgi:transketolase
VFVLLGDGECDEGSVWEAAASAAHYSLNNLVVIIDKNRIQYDGETKDVLSMDPLPEKWESFGWDTVTIDGHDIEAIHDTLIRPFDKPLAVIADTIKGKGVSFMENNPRWHNARLTQTEFEQAMAEQEDK